MRGVEGRGCKERVSCSKGELDKEGRELVRTWNEVRAEEKETLHRG
jgi:hypothetical protein